MLKNDTSMYQANQKKGTVSGEHPKSNKKSSPSCTI